MLTIEIHIPRPVATLITLLAVIAAATWGYSASMQAATPRGPVPAIAPAARGGPDTSVAVRAVHVAESDVRGIRVQQAVLERREEILRAQLRALEEERRTRTGDVHPDEDAQWRRSEAELRALLQDRRESEARLLESLQQIRELDAIAPLTRGTRTAKIRLDWPVEPERGISATFQDPAYAQLFGVAHTGLDIPVPQGTVIRAAADGTVEDIRDNGYGFNSITLLHDGSATLYGHVTSFLVEEGQTVRQGDPIALSGGRPGTPGAGSLTTGPHLHLELFVDGTREDPLRYLPPRDTVSSSTATHAD